MFEDARQFSINARQTLHRYADASVIQRTRPCRRLGDVAEGVLRVKNHANRFRRRKIQLGFNLRIVPLQCSEHVAGQRRRSRAAVAQLEVAALVLLITFLFILIGQRFVQRQLDFFVRPHRQRALPLRNCLV